MLDNKLAQTDFKILMKDKLSTHLLDILTTWCIKPDKYYLANYLELYNKPRRIKTIKENTRKRQVFIKSQNKLN
jgi:hypothetical protein